MYKYDIKDIAPSMLIDFRYKCDIITDMRRLVVNLDDELSDLLAKRPNQNETVREALNLYIRDITPDTLRGIRASYEIIGKFLKEIDSKVDYLARK